MLHFKAFVLCRMFAVCSSCKNYFSRDWVGWNFSGNCLLLVLLLLLKHNLSKRRCLLFLLKWYQWCQRLKHIAPLHLLLVALRLPTGVQTLISQRFQRSLLRNIYGVSCFGLLDHEFELFHVWPLHTFPKICQHVEINVVNCWFGEVFLIVFELIGQPSQTD